jgi:ABC-type branched-subunit amino acid transport system substrate-binding protein
VGVSRQAVRDALAEVGRGQPAFEGPLGPIGFDENGDVTDPRVYVGVAQDGRMVLAEGQ